MTSEDQGNVVADYRAMIGAPSRCAVRHSIERVLSVVMYEVALKQIVASGDRHPG